MTDHEHITRWLQATKPSYQEGHALLSRLSNNTFLIEILATDDDWNRKKLTAELIKISQSIAPTKAPEQVRRQMATEAIYNDLKRPSDRADVPEQIATAVAQRKALYKEAAALHAKLAIYDTDEKRLQASLRIINIFDQIAPLWQLTTYYDLHGSLPPIIQTQESDIPDLDSVTLNAEWLNGYKYLRAYAAKPTHHERCVTRIARMKAIETELTKRDAFQHRNLSYPSLG